MNKIKYTLNRLKAQFTGPGRNPYVILMAVMLLMMIARNWLYGGTVSIVSAVVDKLLILPGIIIGISLHEFGHAWMSNRLGDPTPKSQGRLTVNPLAHIDVIGFLCLLFAGFGWGVPVEINPRYYKNKRRDEFLVGIAGVTVNLIIALFFAVLLRFMYKAGMLPATYSGGFTITGILFDIVQYIININIVLMIFNLIPVPPLDGFGIATQIFNLERYDWYWRIKSMGIFILLILVMFNVTGMIISPIANAVLTAIYNGIVFS